MAYTAPTLTQAQAALAARLNDPSNVRWVAAELTRYLREAIRTWNAWTAHFRDQGSFSTTIAQAFYDLPTVIPSQRAYTVTNWDLVADLQYALLEPAAAGGTWTGTDQFTLDQLSTAIWRRRDQFLRETGMVLTRSVTAYTPPPVTGRIALDEAVLQVRRAAWRPAATGTLLPLARTDEWAANNFGPAWTACTAAPFAYSVSVTPPLFLQLVCFNNGADGSLDLVSVNKGATVDAAVSATLGIPDDWTWVVKFGALADLLHGDGLALDPSRAAYCEQRWQQGIAQARNAAVVLAARIDDEPCTIGALNDADSYSPLWQLLPGVPSKLLLAGGNLLASWPPPGGGGPWTITLDVIANAPVPAVGADVLQIGADIYDSILDYAQHLALFKEGAGQLDLATALLERAARAAGIELNLQQASQPSRAPLLNQTLQDEHAVARGLPVVAVD
jgi:hypothetical protein